MAATTGSSTELVPATAAEDEGDAGEWSSEPQTLDELEARYDILHSFPGRNANTVLKITGATEKGQADAKLVTEGQNHKLWLVLGSVSGLCNTSIMGKPTNGQHQSIIAILIANN